MGNFIKIIVGILKSAIVIFLCMHLFGIHARLLFHINPDKIIIEGIEQSFSFLNFNENNIISSAFAGAYSIATVLILVIFDRRKKINIAMIIVFSLLDGFGVFLYYNIHINDLALFGSIYYSCYTVVIFLAIGFINFVPEVEVKHIEEERTETTEEKVLRMLDNGMKQKDIARIIGVSQPLISKIKSRHEKKEN